MATQVRKIAKLGSLGLAGAFFLFLIYQTPWVQKTRYPMPYKSVVQKNAIRYGVDPLLVTAVIREESKFLPKSRSPAGARGVMQLMPETAEWAAERIGLQGYRLEQLYEPETNIMLGSWYLADLAKQFNNNTVLVLAAYNGGRGRVKEWLEHGDLSLGGQIEQIPIVETREYVRKVLNSYTRYKQLYPELSP